MRPHQRDPPILGNRVEHAVDHDIGHGRVIRVHAGSSRGDNDLRLVKAKHPRHRQPRRDAVTDEAILESKGDAVDAENRCCAGRLRLPNPSGRMARGLAVAQVDEEHGATVPCQFCRDAAHDRFEVVRVAPNAMTSYGRT